jgi:hypothetical protein
MTHKLLTVKRGDTWKFQFAWKNNNTPIDLTDCTALMQVRVKRTGELVAQALTNDDSIVIDGPDGIVNVAFTDTTDAPAGVHEADLQVTFPDGTIQSSSTIQIVVEEDISRV